MFLSRKLLKAQSVLEYVILIAIVLSALLLSQVIIKRGFSGSLKEAADKMGEPYSPNCTTTRVDRKMLEDQYINEEINTTRSTGEHVGIDQFIPSDFGYEPKYVADMGVHSYTEHLNQKFTTTVEQRTDSFNQEVFRWSEAPTTIHDDFPPPF